MKNIMIMIAVLFSATIFAQDNKPTFEKQGDLVKGTFYHDNGVVQQEGFYKGKKLHGEWFAYNAEGKKTAQGQYDNGVKTGKWFFWNSDKLSEVDYSNNKVASVVTWSNKDNIVSNQ